MAISRSGAFIKTYLYDGMGELVRRSRWHVWYAPGTNDMRDTFVDGIYEEQNGPTTPFVATAQTSCSPAAKITKYYTAFGRVIATRVNGVLSYNLADHLGSTVQQIDAANTPGPAIKYFPFGAPRNGTTSPERAFTGQQREDDSPLGMYYYHARFYSSVLGHFVSADTSARDGLDRYTYVRNNPVKAVDPSGHAETGLLDGLGNASAQDVSSCASNPMACLSWSAGGDDFKYYELVSAHFHVELPLLFAIVRNQSQTWKLSKYFGVSVDDIQAGIAAAIDAAENDFGPLVRVIVEAYDFAATDVLHRDPADPSLGIAQVKLSTARLVQNAGLVPKLSVRETIETLKDDRGGVFYAAAYISYLSTTLGTTSPLDLIPAYLIGAPAFRFQADNSKDHCGGCGVNGRAEITKVWPLYISIRDALEVSY